MHEYSIVSALIDQVEAQARRAGATKVASLTVKLGEISGVDGGLLATAFETFRERGVCAGAELHIEPVPAHWSCRRCGASAELDKPLRCLRCDLPLELKTGDEIILSHLELELPDDVH